jgi:hypothetical protein
MSYARLPHRVWMVALAGVLGAGGFGLSLAYTGSAAALELPTVTTVPLPLPTPTVTAPLPTPTATAPTPTVSVPTPTLPAPTPTLPTPTPTVPAPTPTVPIPTPTVPAPTPTVSTPTATVAAPTPTVSVPGVPVPTSSSAPAPTPSSPGSPSAGSPTGSVLLLGSAGTGPGGAPGSSGSGSAPVGNAGTTAAGAAGGSAPAPISGSSATTRGIQVTNVRGRRGTVRVVFRLARGGRVVVTVRGPLPDCSRVVRFVIQGRRGENALRFNGRVGGRRLAEGSYLVGLRPVRAALTRWGALLIDASGARALPRSAADSAVAHCSSAPAEATLFAIGFLAGAEQRDALPVGGGAGGVGVQGGSAAPTGVEWSRRASVLGMQQLEAAADAFHPALGIAILTILLTLTFWFILGLVYLVVSYVRGEGIARPRL